MKLQFLGSGAAFVPITENYQSNMILESFSGRKLLIDCGTDARHSLKAAQLSYKDIDAIYISHFHADHVGGLEWLAFRTKFETDFRPKLYIHPSMVTNLWEKVLRGGLESLRGAKASLEDYFDVQVILDGKYFIWESLQFELIKTTHIYNGPKLIPSYGLFIKDKNTNLFITTDTRFIPDEFMKYYQSAHLIFHDCELSQKPSGVHTRFSELVLLEPDIKSKIWLYHYTADVLPDALAHGFKGFVQRGQQFIF
ncbi:MAG: MBL fold metallo-hydrolase [Legionella sp.]|nr:MBL fold metallo-hydrolase [Legionella sp.]